MMIKKVCLVGLLLLANLSFADTTFILDEKLKKQEWKEWHEFKPVKTALQSKLTAYNRRTKQRAVIEFYDVPCEKILSPGSNCFVYTVYLAYDRHRKLVISPDDI